VREDERLRASVPTRYRPNAYLERSVGASWNTRRDTRLEGTVHRNVQQRWANFDRGATILDLSIIITRLLHRRAARRARWGELDPTRHELRLRDHERVGSGCDRDVSEDAIRDGTLRLRRQ
jgi:hypothetical protein